MFLATLICSDEACAEEVEVVVSHALDALDASACACGCTHVLLAVSGWERAEVRAPAPALVAA
jgi:ethanolamine utilization microcompartment shell protein EutL